MPKQAAAPLKQHTIDSSTSVPSTAFECKEDNDTLLNEDKIVISLSELIANNSHTIDYCSILSLSGIINEVENNQSSIVFTTAANSTSTPSGKDNEAAVGCANNTEDRDCSNNSLANHQSIASKISHGKCCIMHKKDEKFNKHMH